MNYARIKANWTQLKGASQQRWGALTGNSVAMVAGKRQHTLGEIEAAYAVLRETNAKQLADWRARQHKVDPIHR